jgi:hypothetical protein
MRRYKVSEVDAQTGATLGTKHLVLLLGVELVVGAAGAAVIVPFDVRCEGVCFWGQDC